jgi:hypothetical protein
VCSGYLWDDDIDGYLSDACGGEDCDDNNAAVNPGVPENCLDLLNVDEDCDGLANSADADCNVGTCTGATASTLGASPAYGASDLGKHLVYLLLPVGAVIGLRIWRRKR